MGLQDKLKIGGGSKLSLNNGEDYSVAGRDKNEMQSQWGTMHFTYSLNGKALTTGNALLPSWISQFGSQLNTIPVHTKLSGTISPNYNNGSKYLDALPENAIDIQAVTRTLY